MNIFASPNQMTMRNRLFSFLFFSALSFSCFAQNTIGLMEYNTDEVDPGYNLVFPHGQQEVWLLDNCGRICHFWDGDTYNPGNEVFLGENGLLYKAVGNGATSNQWFHAGGGGECLEIRSMDNVINWQWCLSDSIHRLHHDFTVLENGNILAIAWERYFEADCLAAGADPERLVDGELWSEVVYEIEPVGTDEANIVWEWHAWDHLVQDANGEAENFGIIGDNIGRIDINYTPDSVGDWLHANAIDYNPNLDLIALSIPTFNEVWVIDHSTTTEQAATSNGGFTGSGGDLVYRWGNPAAYQQGTEEDQTLHYQHHVHWLDLELAPGHPDYGKMAAFSNRLPNNTSEVVEWTAIFDDYEWEFPLTDGAWGPAEPSWTFQTEDPSQMYSTILSSVQRLENGNTLIGVGRWARGIEINEADEVVWEYRLPLLSGAPAEQGTQLEINANLLWRIIRYSPEYPGLADYDLTPQGYLELNPNVEECPLVVSVDEVAVDLEWSVFPNPTADQVTVALGQLPAQDILLGVYDAQGRLISMERKSPDQRYVVDLTVLSPGTYTVSLSSAELGLHTQTVVRQ